MSRTIRTVVGNNNILLLLRLNHTSLGIGFRVSGAVKTGLHYLINETLIGRQLNTKGPRVFRIVSWTAFKVRLFTRNPFKIVDRTHYYIVFRLYDIVYTIRTTHSVIYALKIYFHLIVYARSDRIKFYYVRLSL